MKIRFFIFPAFLVTASPLLAQNSADQTTDTPAPTNSAVTTEAAAPTADTICGDYKASFNYKALWKHGPGSSGEGVTPVITITPEAAETVKITIPPFFFSEKFHINTFVISGVKTQKQSDGSTAISLGEFTSTDGENKVKGYSVNGTIVDQTIKFTAVYKVGNMPFKMYVDFVGNR